MDAELKAKWIEALRSGRYKQAKGRLRSEDGYCCLGVLAEEIGMRIAPDGFGVIKPDGSSGYSPIWDITDEHHARTLATMNDKGESFAVISDYIESVV